MILRRRSHCLPAYAYNGKERIKRESGMALKKREFTPKAVMLTPMIDDY